MKKYIFSKYLSELSSLSHFWNVPWDSEWYFENMSSFHFLTIKNAYNVKMIHINDISQAISNFSLFHPKGPFRNVKGLMILKGISKMSFFHFLPIKNVYNGKTTLKNDISQDMPNMRFSHPFFARNFQNLHYPLTLTLTCVELFCINIQDKGSLSSIIKNSNQKQTRQLKMDSGVYYKWRGANLPPLIQQEFSFSTPLPWTGQWPSKKFFLPKMLENEKY